MANTRTRSGEVGVAGVCIMLGVALAVRLPMLVADFWFDEIFWLERFVRPAASAFDIFFNPAFRHDNNHHLQTLAGYLIGGSAPWIAYRIPPLVLGLAAMAAAMWIGRRHGRASANITALLVGVSSMMVVYSTEARGYAAAIAAAAFGFLALERFLIARNAGAALLFGAAIALGLAAHPAILHFYLGALLWSGYRLRHDRRALIRLHLFPAVWIPAWFALVVRRSIIAGGPPWTWRQIADESLAWTFGYPIGTVAPALVGGMLLLLILWDARALWNEGSDEGLFSIGAIVAPVILMAALSPPYLFPRYFLVPLFFLLIVVGRSLARLLSRRGAPRVIAVATLCAVVAGNLATVAPYARERHRNHARAVALMLSNSTSQVRVTSPSLDQWTDLPLRFHALALGASERIVYVPRDTHASLGPDAPIDWLVEPDQPCGNAPPAARALANGKRFVLRESFSLCGPAGMTWHLYEGAADR